MKLNIQIAGRLLVLLITYWFTIGAGFAQPNDTSATVRFRAESDILIDTYPGNTSALYQLDAIIREHKTAIINRQAYIQLVAGVAHGGGSADNSQLNIAATQASVVKAYIRSKYGLSNDHFTFYFSEELKANTVQISCLSESTPKRGAENIFYTAKVTSPATIQAAMARYGAKMPFLNPQTTTQEAENGHADQQKASPQNTPENTAKERSNSYSIDFTYGSHTLYAAYRNNKAALAAVKAKIAANISLISEKKELIRILSIIPRTEKGNIAAINFASIRGAVIRQWLRDNFAGLREADFAFYISAEGDRNAVEVSLVGSSPQNEPQPEIFFSLAERHPEKIDYAVARYKRVPFLDGSTLFEQTGMDFNITDPALDPGRTHKTDEPIDEKIIVTIYYRWDKDNLDKTYLTNAKTLVQIDSLLKLKSADYIDSLRIVAYASPEGPPDYNKRLSERRAKTLKEYLLATYPQLRAEQISTDAKGENWDGFRRMALADPRLPMKERVLSIIDNPNITDLQRQAQIAALDGGRLYKNYILPNYYRYLRTGASLFVVYSPLMPADIDLEPITVIVTEPEPLPIAPPMPIPVPEPTPEPELPIASEPKTTYTQVRTYPIALRTNLLYDAVGAVNLGLEIPFGKTKRWSGIIDGAYAYWRSPKNLYALQTLEGGAEVRYWLPVRKTKKESNHNWAKPLKGWNVGVYGRYWKRYDAQWIDGVQGDGTWSAGLTVGYAFPVGRKLALEASIGGGWLSTSEYRHYHQPEYDQNGKYHLMWQQTGVWSGLTITKVRFSLVWLIESSKKVKSTHE